MTAGAVGPVGWAPEGIDDVLQPWVDAGVLGSFEVHLVRAVVRRAPARPSDDCLLALALSARATRLGHVCLDLRTAHDQVVAAQDDAGRTAGLSLPDPVAWRTGLAASAVVGGPDPEGRPDALLLPLVLDGHRLYLQRFWRFEVEVAAQLGGRADPSQGGPTLPDEQLLTATLDGLFGGPPAGADGDDLQYVAARRALTSPVSVVAGGPGTGKTHTVARILAAALDLAARDGERFQVALAAPTGKAATRMKEAVEAQVAALSASGHLDASQAAALRAIEPTTIHRLLGRRSRTSFRHDRDDPLVHDLVVIDETSMVSLPLLARLLDAVRPEARLVLVGDPFQLASIDAGTVLGDMVGSADDGVAASSAVPLAGRVTELRVGHRFDAGSGIAELALAIRDGDADRVVDRLRHAAGVHWVRPDDAAALGALRSDVVAAATDTVAAALADDGPGALAAATRLKVLAAVRRGPLGLFEWNDLIDDAALAIVPTVLRGGWPRPGTPVMVTRNDPVNRLANGDVGVVVHTPGGRWVVMAGSSEPRRLAPARLGEWEPWWAMTIHKSQGSEFPHAVVSLPTVDSPILTRELLYTAVTRGKDEVTMVGSEELVRVAVGRAVARASGLRDRLWPAG